MPNYIALLIEVQEAIGNFCHHYENYESLSKRLTNPIILSYNVIMITSIRESITRNSLASARSRLIKLESMNAPKPLIEGTKNQIAALERGELQVAHIEEFGSLEYTAVEVKTGRMGKQYISFTTAQGIINYFPSGKFGAFVSMEKKS